MPVNLNSEKIYNFFEIFIKSLNPQKKVYVDRSFSMKKNFIIRYYKFIMKILIKWENRKQKLTL